jgi:hypothetical protein
MTTGSRWQSDLPHRPCSIEAGHGGAGRLDQALRYADRAREIGDAYMDARLRAWRAAEAEP